jgi:uncharacterized protein (TIGR03083 family)
MTRHSGMADDRTAVAGLVLGAWDTFLAQAAAADLGRPTRLPGWRAHEVCVHLGLWDDHRALADMVDTARAGGRGVPADVDAVNARVTATHRSASRDEVLAALSRHRAATERYLTEAPAELDTAPTVSTVGRLPVLSVVLGQAYELAVHGLDLVPCGAPAAPAGTLQAGLAALADVTGALAAGRGIAGGATLATPDGGWRFAADDEGWTVTPVPAGTGSGTVVSAEADLLLEAASGRVNPVVALARRRLRVRQLEGLLELAPIVQSAPGIPGGPLLALTARTVGSAGFLLGRFRRSG